MSAILLAIFAKQPGVSPNSSSIFTKFFLFPYIGLIVRVSVLRSKLINTSSPSLRLSASLNSFGITKRHLVSNVIIEFIFPLNGNFVGIYDFEYI